MYQRRVALYANAEGRPSGDINKDVLKGGETVKANMRIRLPKTATASVN